MLNPEHELTWTLSQSFPHVICQSDKSLPQQGKTNMTSCENQECLNHSCRIQGFFVQLIQTGSSYVLFKYHICRITMQVEMVVGGGDSTTITPRAHWLSVTLRKPVDDTKASTKTLVIKGLDKGDFMGTQFMVAFWSDQSLLVRVGGGHYLIYWETRYKPTFPFWHRVCACLSSWLSGSSEHKFDAVESCTPNQNILNGYFSIIGWFGGPGFGEVRSRHLQICEVWSVASFSCRSVLKTHLTAFSPYFPARTDDDDCCFWLCLRT